MNPDAPPGLTGTVLCIEDEPVSMALVEAILAPHTGVRLLKATGGREGLRLALAERPDLVLLDMNLPDIGGLQVVRELSEAIAERALRVVLLTSDSFSIDVVKALSLGAHEYWHKPLTSERLAVGLARALDAARRGSS
ncbi:MAG: response regulator [Burkholderiales bacterium]|nr:response regulator [Burkholderiales bacterium]